MISGVVLNDEAIVRLVVKDAQGNVEPVEFVVDTGFSGSICVPPSLTLSLACPHAFQTPAILADGRIKWLDSVELTLDWDGEERLVDALVISGQPLLGMRALRGSELTLEISEGGLATISPL